ncbi:DUF4817 domain-containing protein [Trichonephila clavipes]|nr:DUF4817 domain-containing protein [Trichonephila clavipes]
MVSFNLTIGAVEPHHLSQCLDLADDLQGDYTDDRRDDYYRSCNGIYIKSDKHILRIQRRNQARCSVFRSELIAIDEALGSLASLPNGKEIWILSDSESAIQQLSNWQSVRDNVGVSILTKLKRLSTSHQIHMQWIPTLIDLAGNEITDTLVNCQVIYSQFGLAIHQNDHQAWRRFVEWAKNEIAVVPDFHKRILFSDEAHFWLNGYVNKQNSRIWSEANPQVYVETPLHKKMTVWCDLWAGGIIGPYFFKNDEGHNVTVNGDRYRAMITNFFIPELNKHDVQELWFQQDGATCHTARATIDLLKDTFDDRLILRFGPVNWPPSSCHLNPLDNFLWGYVKSLVYADKPQTLDHLEDNIRRVIADRRPQMLEKVIEN